MPRCTIQSSDCRNLWDDYYLFNNLFHSVQSNWTTVPGPMQSSPTPPVCNLSTYSTSCDPSSSNAGWWYPCYLKRRPVQLAYFPVTAVGFPCGNRTIIPNNGTGISTAQAFGTVVTSPSVIVSFSTLYALDNCGNTVGTPLSNFLLPQRADQIATDCGRYPRVSGQPVLWILLIGFPPYRGLCTNVCRNADKAEVAGQIIALLCMMIFYLN